MSDIVPTVKYTAQGQRTVPFVCGNTWLARVTVYGVAWRKLPLATTPQPPFLRRHYSNQFLFITWAYYHSRASSRKLYGSSLNLSSRPVLARDHVRASTGAGREIVREYECLVSRSHTLSKKERVWLRRGLSPRWSCSSLTYDGSGSSDFMPAPWSLTLLTALCRRNYS